MLDGVQPRSFHVSGDRYSVRTHKSRSLSSSVGWRTLRCPGPLPSPTVNNPDPYPIRTYWTGTTESLDTPNVGYIRVKGKYYVTITQRDTVSSSPPSVKYYLLDSQYHSTTEYQFESLRGPQVIVGSWIKKRLSLHRKEAGGSPTTVRGQVRT